MCERTAVWRIESGPDVNSCSSRTEISYSLRSCQYDIINDQAAAAIAGTRGATEWNWMRAGWTYVSSIRGLFNKSLRRC